MSKQTNIQVAMPPKHEEPETVLTTLVGTTQRHHAKDVSIRLAEMREWLADDLAQLEDYLEEVVVDPTKDLAWAAASYFLERAGKRVRPICVMLAARMGDREFDQAVKQISVSAELVHSATLLHDDVIDLGEDRRGRAAARVIYGNAASVLGGDHLLVDALRRVHEAAPQLTGSLMDVIAQMVHAEALQLDLRKSFRPDRDLYSQVVRGKTAALFAWSLEAGGHLGGLAPHRIQTLGQIGADLGMTFQLVDDVLDLCGDPSITGKDTALDLREGKLTWPTILAAERSPELLLRLRQFAGSDYQPSTAEIVDLIGQIKATGAIEDTFSEAQGYALKAQESLTKLPENPARAALQAVVVSALKRSR